MKLRWREHERLLVTLLTLLTLGSYCWNMFMYLYRQNDPGYRPPLNYYIHVFFPKAGPVLLMYFCYLWINIRIVPRLTAPGNELPAGLSFFGQVWAFLLKHAWPIIQSVILYVLLGICFSMVSRFGLFPVSYFHPPPVIVKGFYAALQLVLFYTVYLVIREAAIGYIERSQERRSWLVLIANNTTVFVVCVTLFVKVLSVLDLVRDWRVIAVFYSLLLCTFFVVMYNVYWLFPRHGKKRFFNVRLFFRLPVLTLISSLLSFSLFSNHNNGRFFFLLWLFELFIVTPVSWLIYQFRKDKILQLRGIEKELVQSKSNLAFLRSQINPHFLFNALNTLYGTALQEQADRTAEGIQKLGDMMRFMLHENHLEQIKMSREIEYLQNYISLQKLRTATSDAIVIEDDIRTAHCDHMIAPMLLIPFVENAFKHGISLQEKSWINISLRCDEQHIIFETRNSVHARPPGHAGNDTPGIGLHNVRERLRLLYPGRYDLEVNSGAHEFLVKLVIRS